MKKTERILVKVIATIAVLLVALLIIYFATTKTAFDGSWGHTYFPGSILFFCVIGLIVFFIQKKIEKKGKEIPSRFPGRVKQFLNNTGDW